MGLLIRLFFGAILIEFLNGVKLNAINTREPLVAKLLHFNWGKFNGEHLRVFSLFCTLTGMLHESHN